MSLILDALNRAERERRNIDNPVPDLQTVHVSPAPSSSDKRRVSGFILLLAVVFIIFIAAVWFWQKKVTLSPADVPVVTAPAVTPAEPKAAPRVEQSKTTSTTFTSSVVTKMAAPEKDNVVATAVTEANPVTGVTAVLAPQVTETTDAAPDAPVDELAALYATAEKSESDPDLVSGDSRSLYDPLVIPQELSPPVSTSLPPAMSGQEEIRNYESLRNLPDVGDLPWSLRQEIPSINYARHHFEDGQTSVMINGRSWQTGAEIASDLRLEEIYVDGVVMSFRQMHFKLRALNSWINM